ncbi:MAG: 2-C-methyl-D-erythritol 2,4-cyclodiphosphate synthase [Clostridia bacterium]|nr:2-C-methyl-D-erythritol 2,4-cyclodiphosphate synthase [Clostridia bacterium]
MKKTVAAILLAAGSSSRMGGVNKMLAEIGGRDPIDICVGVFSRHADSIVIAVSDATRPAAERAAANVCVPVIIVGGGARRQDSVMNALLAADADLVAVHDCARCLVSDEVIKRAIDSAREFGSGVAAVKMRDTVRRIDTGETVDREGLYLMQTPQCFDREKLLEAYRRLDGDVTDDAAVWQTLYGSARLTEGSMENQKLTEREDLEFFERLAGKRTMDMRIGIGEDTHRLTEGRKLVLGGVEIPFRLGLLGHSDADALIHAIIDALLGAAALGDIGGHFPDSDPAYKDISSLVLLERTAELIDSRGYSVSNVDATVTAQEPKLKPYIEEMRKKIADALGVGVEKISIKATTPEHLGPEGRSEGITARAVACIIGV